MRFIVKPHEADRSILRVWLRARRTWPLLAAGGLLGILAAGFGRHEVALPSATDNGTTSLQHWQLTTILLGLLPVLALHSPLADLEAAHTNRYALMRHRYLAILAASMATTYVAIASTALSAPILLIAARSYFTWLGLALIAGRIWGWRQCWILPLATLCIIIYWGGSSQPPAYAWWNFSAHPHTHVPSLILSASISATAIATYAWTPWTFTRLATEHNPHAHTRKTSMRWETSVPAALRRHRN